MKKLSIFILAAALFLSANAWGHTHGEDSTEKVIAPRPELNLETLEPISMEMEEPAQEAIFSAKARFRFLLEQVDLKPFEGKIEKAQPLR